jgi:hypothetical protein
MDIVNLFAIYAIVHIIIVICRVFILYVNSESTSFGHFSKSVNLIYGKKILNPFFYRINLENIVKYREFAKWVNSIQLTLLIFDIFLITGGIKLIQTYELISEW